MGKITTINITDYTRIKKVTPKFPELMNTNAEENLKYLHESMLRAKKELEKSRELIRLNEASYNSLKEEFNSKASLFDIEYECTTKEHIINDSNISIQGMGNEILGKMY